MAVSEELDSVPKAHALSFHDPVDHRAVRLAGPQTVPQVLLGCDDQARLPVLMKGAQPDQVSAVPAELNTAGLDQALD